MYEKESEVMENNLGGMKSKIIRLFQLDRE